MRKNSAENGNKNTAAADYIFTPCEDFDSVMDEIVELILKS